MAKKPTYEELEQMVKELKKEADERKQAEEVLKESGDAYKATFETTGTAMLIGEEDTTISMINAEFEKLCGYSKEEVEGKKRWIEFIVKADLERMKGYHNLRMTDPEAAPPYYEYQFIDKQGNVRDCLITLALIPGTKKTVGSIIDITNRVHAEEALKESEQKYRILSEQSTDAIYITTHKGKLAYVNQSFLDLFGYTREEITDMKAQEMYVNADDRSMFQQEIE
ncbi:MAG: PAS domain S-box protein, partial [Proteobacteria bacterium]|nr:PAS domain S-box protein [Pseudomonadota bacterium]